MRDLVGRFSDFSSGPPSGRPADRRSRQRSTRSGRAPSSPGARFAAALLAAIAVAGSIPAAQTPDRRQLDRIEEALRQEGEAVVALAEAAAANRPVPSDFSIQWHNDFLKAQSGTFIPFIVRIFPPSDRPVAALLYVRAARRPVDKPPGRRGTAAFVAHPFEEIFPIDLASEPGQAVRIARGFSLAPGEYDVTVVVRERAQGDAGGRPRAAGVLRRPLTVPDFATGELATSTVMVADRLVVLGRPLPPDELPLRPYVVAGREIYPAADTVFGRGEELIVVFLVYNPAVTLDKQFDLEVEYHFFRRSGPGETYFNRTEPQRFTPASLGPEFDPSAGHPVMAGQGVPLAAFEEGDYRLAIKITDRIAGRTIDREARFTVRGTGGSGRGTRGLVNGMQWRKPWNAIRG
jgi:hypothetical protein